MSVIRGDKTVGCQTKTNASKFEAFAYLLIILAGGESLNWHPLVEDFILVARKLEKLGFIDHRRSVMIIESLVEDRL